MSTEPRSRGAGARSVDGHQRRPRRMEKVTPPHGEIEPSAEFQPLQLSYPASHMSFGPVSGATGLVGRVVGGAGVVGVAYYQPMVFEGLGALALLLVLGVVFPAVWSRDAVRRRAAATVLRLLLTALVGTRIATAVAAQARQQSGETGQGRTSSITLPADQVTSSRIGT